MKFITEESIEIFNNDSMISGRYFLLLVKDCVYEEWIEFSDKRLPINLIFDRIRAEEHDNHRMELLDDLLETR